MKVVGLGLSLVFGFEVRCFAVFALFVSIMIILAARMSMLY